MHRFERYQIYTFNVILRNSERLSSTDDTDIARVYVNLTQSVEMHAEKLISDNKLSEKVVKAALNVDITLEYYILMYNFNSFL